MGSFAQGAMIEQVTSTPTTGGTTSLVAGSTTWQRFTGVNSEIVKLPDATLLKVGRYFVIESHTSNSISVQYDGSVVCASIPPNSQRVFHLYDNSTSDGDWVISPPIDIDEPLALFGSRPVFDQYLNIAANQIESGLGSWKSTPPLNDLISIFSGAVIDFQSSASTGGVTGGTVKTTGGVFTRPTITSSQYTRMALVYHADNYIDTTFSAGEVTLGALPNPGAMFATLEGTPIGYIDLESEGTFNFKTAGSSTGIISNVKIYRFSSGAGAGGAGGDESFKLQSVAIDGTTVLKGGKQSVYAGTGIMLVSTYDGTGSAETDFGKDLTIDLDNLEVAPTNDTTYHMFIDLFTLATTPTTVTETGVNLFPIEEANLVLKTDDPYNVESSQFVYLGSVRYATAQWSVAVTETAPTKRHSSSIGVDNSLEYSLDFTAVSTVGTVGQLAAGHTLMAPSFPSSADVSWYNLDGDVLDGNTTNAHDLTATGSPTYGTGILGLAASDVVLDGATQYLNSTDAYFNPGDADHSFGGWFNSDDWTTDDQTLMANWGSSGNYSFKVAMDASDNLVIYTSVDGTAIVSDTIIAASSLSGWHFISLVYTASANSYKCYVDGTLNLVHALGGNLNTSASSNFTVGSDAGANFFDGNIDEIFFSTDTALTDDQIQKIYATKISHNRGLSAVHQAWSATVVGSGQYTLPNTSFIVDMGLNDLYADFSELDSALLLALTLQSKGALGRSTPIQSREIQATASAIDAILPITHNIGSLPYVVLLADDGSGNYVAQDSGTYFKSTNTQIITTGTTLTSGLGSGTVNCVLRWANGAQGVVAQYREWTTKVVSTTTVLSNNDRVLANPTGQLDLTLPANPSLGWSVRIADFDGTWSGTDYVRAIPSGSDTVMGAAFFDFSVVDDKVELTYNGSGDWRPTGAYVPVRPSTAGLVPTSITHAYSSDLVSGYHYIVDMSGATGAVNMNIALGATEASLSISAIRVTEQAGYPATPYYLNVNTSGSDKFWIDEAEDTVVVVGQNAGHIELAWDTTKGYIVNVTDIYTARTLAGAWTITDTLAVDTINEYTATKGVAIQGKTDGVAVAAGYVGELKETTTHVAVTPTTGATTTVMSISLEAGIWDISGGSVLSTGAGTTTTAFGVGISTTTNTWDVFSGMAVMFMGGQNMAASTTVSSATPIRRVNLSATTSYFLVVRTDFTGGVNTYTTDKSYIRATRIA